MGTLVTLLGSIGLNIFSSVLEKGTKEVKTNTLKFIEKKTGIVLNEEKTEFSKEEIKILQQAEKEFITKTMEMNLESFKISTRDKSNARAMNINLGKYQSPWLVKNTGSLIALITTIFTFGLWYAMLMGFTDKVNENILFAINSGLTLSLGYVLSFYFGSSKNESDVQKSRLHQEEQKNIGDVSTTDIVDTNLEIK